MPGRGPAPKSPEQRRGRAEPIRGEWISTLAVGWQHGDVPKPPAGLLKASRDAWSTWMGAWFAAHWSPADLPGLRTVVRLYDQVERGEFVRAGELRQQMDNYGITPKGQQDRRWRAPQHRDPAPSVEEATGTDDGGKVLRSDRWADLRVVDGE